MVKGVKSMNNQSNLIAANLRYLRNKTKWSQEHIAEKIGVSRQAVAKWENGETMPDIINCAALADLYEVSLNELVRHDPEESGMPIGPVNKYIFGVVTVGERGQVVLPKKARDTLGIKAGDSLVVLGDTNPATEGLAMLKNSTFARVTGETIEKLIPKSEEH